LEKPFVCGHTDKCILGGRVQETGEGAATAEVKLLVSVEFSK